MQALTVAAVPASIACVATDDSCRDSMPSDSDSDRPYGKPLVASASPSSVLGSVQFDDVLQLDSKLVSVAQVCRYVVGKVDGATSGVAHLCLYKYAAQLVVSAIIAQTSAKPLCYRVRLLH